MLVDYQRICGKQFSDVLLQSEIIYNPNEVNRFGNKFNVDFNFASDLNEEMDIIFFSTLLNKELRMRGLPHGGNMDDRRSRLRTHLMIEQRLLRIRDAINRMQEGKEAALVLIKQVVPCIMHTENRGGETIITEVVVIGATEFQVEGLVKAWNYMLNKCRILFKLGYWEQINARSYGGSCSKKIRRRYV